MARKDEWETAEEVSARLDSYSAPATMATMTFVFIEDGHASKSVVTAETQKECVEKYFLKYPERHGDNRVRFYEGDRLNIGFELAPKNGFDLSKLDKSDGE